ncbi:hypothetical protein AALP_AAs47265U000100 [Arabis alpina]|uniref:RRM domain-containing protein n=1 Tax=Arabis alpina TaxID=50452 RepID=A0A087G228_ARAAL|nr:hypothetical protein AALP_AAs47265U000100 [Arabis alpina]
MAESNKKSATMALKEGKREQKDNLQITANLNRQKNDEEPATSAKAPATSSSEDESSSDEEPAARDSSSSEDESEDDSKEVQAEITSSFVSSNSRLEVRTKRGKRATSTPQSGIGGNDDQTIIVKGFDSSLPEDDIKMALSKYFSSCGEITSVVVPTNSETGAVIGCAYIELKEGIEKALKLNGNYLRGWNLLVEKARRISDVGGPSGRGGHWPNPYGHWPYPYRCEALYRCGHC